MKLKYYKYGHGTEGFEVDDEERGAIGGISQATRDGRWYFHAAGEAFHPADYVTSIDLRQMAMVLDYLNGEL